MGHTIWMLTPVWGHDIRAHNPDGFQPNMPMCKDQRPSLDIDAQTHQTAEQDTQVVPAPLLKGEKLWSTATSSEQAATPATPSLPHLPIQRPHPSCTHVHVYAHPNPCASYTTLRPEEWCTLAPPPPCLTPSLCASGTFVEDPEEAGGVTMAEDDAPAPTHRSQWHSINIHSWRPQMQIHPTPAYL